MRKITIEVKINTFGNMLYSLNHPTVKHYKKFRLGAMPIGHRK